jgi:hypothetical protein
MYPSQERRIFSHIPYIKKKTSATKDKKKVTILLCKTPSTHFSARSSLNYEILFSIAGGAITESTIALAFVHALENLWAISESGNILLYRRSAVCCLITTMMFMS